MANILIVGIDPDAVDFTSPALPPGLSPEVIRTGIVRALDALAAAGHAPTHCYIPTDPAAAAAAVAARLAAGPVDCVTIGGGVTRPPENMLLLEAVLNTVAAARPTPRIALVARPEDAAPAAQRVLA